jgi:hypothetical protein
MLVPSAAFPRAVLLRLGGWDGARDTNQEHCSGDDAHHGEGKCVGGAKEGVVTVRTVREKAVRIGIEPPALMNE